MVVARLLMSVIVVNASKSIENAVLAGCNNALRDTYKAAINVYTSIIITGAAFIASAV